MIENQILEARQSQQHNHPHEGIGGNSEQASRLLEAPQIGPAHQSQQQQGKRNGVRQKRRHHRGQCLGASHQAHRRSERVINQQSGCSHQPDSGAKIVPGHHIRTATVGIGRDRLAIGENHDGNQRHDRHGDRER